MGISRRPDIDYRFPMLGLSWVILSFKYRTLTNNVGPMWGSHMIHDVHAHILVRKVFIYNLVAKNSKVIANNLLSIKRQVNT